MARTALSLASSLFLLGALAAPGSAQGTPIGFVETFALAEDRGAVLDQLVPGTEEHYFYSCLHLQQQGELAAVDRLLDEWRELGSSRGYRQLQARQSLLKASTDLEATYTFLERELGLEFDHARVESGVAPDLPTVLDPTRFDRSTLVREILGERRGDAIERFSGPVLESLVRMDLSREQRGALLDRLERPDVPGLVEAVLADLDAYPKSAFGARKIHGLLTLDQLEALRARRSELLSNSSYVESVMRRLAPAPDESMDDPEDRGAYLDRTIRFARLLPDAFNSLKAHLLYRRLVLDLDLGAPDAERLLRYLRLPRNVSYQPLDRRQRAAAANLGDSFGDVTPFGAVGDDQAVVVELMDTLMATAGSYEAYLEVLPEEFVQRVWARSKLVHTDATNIDELVRMLGGPDAADRLGNRVDLDFARTNLEQFGAGDPVSLDVDVKNVDTLIVKVFEIDTVAYFDAHSATVAASIDLDGLIANEERTLTFDEPPLRRKRRSLDLPSLRRPGTYVVELIGGGVSSRAVIRKGALHLLERVGAAGHVFRVLDGDRVPVPTATLRFGGRDFGADERGEIVVPFTTRPGRKTALLRAGGVASIASFDHLGESYALDIAMYAPTEGLLAGKTATVVVRPRLTLNGERIALDLLEDATLILTAVDQDGTTSTKVVDTLELEGTEQFIETIQVPDRLRHLSAQLNGTVRNLSEGQDVSVQSSSRSMEVNGDASTARVARAFFSRLPTGYVVDLRGRNGEPIIDREVAVTVHPRFIGKEVVERLKSDETGRIRLGALAGVRSVGVSGGGIEGSWSIGSDGVRGLPGELRGVAGADLRIPFNGSAGDIGREAASLLEVRGDRPLRDRFDALVREDGFLRLRALPAGDYELTLEQTGESYRVRMVEGELQFGHVVGERRALVATTPVPLTIRRTAANDESLLVQLAGATESTRVHVFTSRFQDRYDPHHQLFLGRTNMPGWCELAHPLSTYESGRTISDEYRYILGRRLLVPYPGNMLARAGVLLSPWALRETTDRMAGAGDEGETYTGEADGLVGARFGGRRSLRAAGGSARVHPGVGFLAEPAAVIAGLVPDGNGVVSIPIADLGTNHMIRIVAVDEDVAVALDLTRPEQPLRLRDLRLVDELDPATPMTQQRRIAFVRAGETIEILDAPNASARTFDTLADVFQLYRTMNSSGEFVAFEFITRWPSLTDEEKLAKFSEYGCHELNVFLREKDPEFFSAIVAPYIASKSHRTFMDEWLLRDDLSRYLEPWRFERLNIVEQILLLRSTGNEAGPVARDQYGLVPRGTFSLDRAFEVVLASGGLAGDASGIAAAIESSRESIRERKRERSNWSEDSAPETATPDRSTAFYAVPSDAPFESDDRQVISDLSLLQERLGETALDPNIMSSGGLPLPNEDLARGRSVDKQRRQSFQAFFRDLDPTEELAETHYWRIPLAQANQHLVTVSPFWVDFAASDGPFVSSSFPLATRSHTEMLLALAFLDLPFEAAEHEITSEGRGVRMSASSPLLLALEDIGPAERVEGDASVLVGQDFFRLDDRTETVDGIDREKFVTGEFLTGVPYGCRMVITNPSSAAIEMQALVQIPRGAIELAGTRVTRGHPLTVPAYGTESLEALFYFPSVGTFRDYPIHVGRGGRLLGAADARSLNVVAKPSLEDTETWQWVSQNADLPRVIAYLGEENPRSLDLSKIAWRMKDRPSFDAVTSALAGRSVYAPILWQYGIRHRDDARTTQFLEAHGALALRVGAPFSSPLLSLDDRDRGSYEHLAYEPLVNGRVHEFGGQRRILNDQFATQYNRFLRAMALRPTLDDGDLMELAYYMLLQDRTGEALDAFDRIDRTRVATQIQYDYMAAYMDFFRGEVEHARTVALEYVDHPVARWRARFRNVIAHLDEIDGVRPVEGFDRDDRDESQGALAGAEPILELDVTSGVVTLTHERLDEVEVRYHLMDVEFLFSTNPFVRGGSGAFGFIEPNRAERVALAVDAPATSFKVPDEFRRSNLFVEVRGGGIARRATFFAGSVVVQGLERYGQVRVVERESTKPLPRAYVKVYARLADGRIRFHKDGYTDLRGRFDYVSVSGWDGAAVERYAVLVMHDEAGATITELAPPVR